MSLEVRIVPSVAFICASSVLYNFIVEVPTPSVKVITVSEAKLISVLFLLEQVGGVTGPEEELAPEKVRVLSPSYPVATLSYWS
ncbi:hypothetical protein ES705_47220 [subsurface metagenome]